MNRMTCSPRLRRGENKFVFLAAICTVLMVTSARGGTLDAPAAPTNVASAMWTLNDIYNVLDTRTTNVLKRAGAFAEPTGEPTNGTMHTLNDIMTLVTNRAPVSKAGETKSYLPYDDGWYGTNTGVASPSPRFTVVGAAGTVETNQIRDNLTGLIWARNANIAGVFPAGKMQWTNAVQYCATNLNLTSINYGGTNDWRLPNIKEMQSLLDWRFYGPGICNTAGTAKWSEGDPFTGIDVTLGTAYYWTSTRASVAATTEAYRINMYSLAETDASELSEYYIWPVRGGGQ